MALPTSSGGKIIPEYTDTDVQGWFNGISDFLKVGVDVAIAFFALAGFLVFALGIIGYMKEQREGGHGQTKGNVWQILLGGSLGALGSIYLLLTRILSIG